MDKFLIKKSKRYKKWATKQSKELISIIDARLDRVADGNFGDHRWFGYFGELRFKFGAGCRIYYTIRGKQVVLLLQGGDKSSQDADIRFIKTIIKGIKAGKGDLWKIMQ